jgi:anti-anti-sigma factor
MAEYRHLEVQKRGEVYVVRFADTRLRNELLIENVARELFDVAEKADCRHLLVNLEGVTMMASAMLGKLAGLHKRLEAEGGKLILCEIGPKVQELLDVTSLNDLFHIRETEMKGVMAFYA